MNILLLGIKGTGKTTLARSLSNELDRDWIDTDQRVEELHTQKTGEELSCREIFSKYKELYFRSLEEEIVGSLESNTTNIISFGGGIVESSINRERIPKLGMAFCLYLQKAVLRDRWNPEIPFYGDFDEIITRRLRLMSDIPSIWLNADSKCLKEIVKRVIDGK